MVLPHFYYTPKILDYDFGPQHPLKPERLRRTIELLERWGLSEVLDPGPGDPYDLLRVHGEAYVRGVDTISTFLENGITSEELRGLREVFGFGSMDNPPFAGMYDAALAYTACSAAAARAVSAGASLAFGIGGGLHHAVRERASGFCIFDDPAVACHILLEKFERVAYVDIDVHHGDGVQWIFYNEPRVLTCSIHEEGRTLFPGTGWTDETGTDFSSFNVPIEARTTGDVWLHAFERTIIPALERYRPGDIVLQLGTDAHVEDPLGHLRCTQGEWLGAVRRVKALGIPIVAIGGGGYNLTTVPRMWISACLTLADQPYPDEVPEDLAQAWQMPTISDHEEPRPRLSGADYADGVVEWLQKNHLPNIPAG